MSEDEIAEKTAETDELKKFPSKELLKPTCPIRVIITKQALQEGWDCPYAYVLCSLAVNRNQRALTQLVGRILRQPGTKKTGRPLLDECYVFCHDAETAKVVELIRKGLEHDGLGDLMGKVLSSDSKASIKTRETVIRKVQFAALRDFFPLVLWVDGCVRELDYERDILYNLDWESVRLDSVVSQAAQIQQTRFVRIDLDILHMAGPTSVKVDTSFLTFDPVYATSSILDIVPNPWVARRIVGRVVEGLSAQGWTERKLAEFGSDILSQLRAHLSSEQERMAQEFFESQLQAGKIQFRLRTDSHVWNLPEKYSVIFPEQRRLVVSNDGSPVKKGVFDVFEHELNNFELKCVQYLEAQAAVQWWHRNVARGQGSYGLQGWRKHRVYPDILFGFESGEDHSGRKLVALETKGDHLQGDDTSYKRRLFELLTEATSATTAVGEYSLVFTDGGTLRCEMVMESDWKQRLAAILKSPVSGSK